MKKRNNMKQLAESDLIKLIAGGSYDGDLPVNVPRLSDAYIVEILALLAPVRTVHHSD
jgi:hypothetical protein